MIDNLDADFPEGHPCVWLPNEYTTRKWQQTEGVEATERLVLRVIPREDGNGGVWIFGDQIRFAVSDGSAVWYEHPYALRPLNPDPELAARLFSHRATSPSPRCEDALLDRWGWLTPAGLGTADRREVTVPRSAVPHLVGRRGQAIQQTENSLGANWDHGWDRERGDSDPHRTAGAGRKCKRHNCHISRWRSLSTN